MKVIESHSVKPRNIEYLIFLVFFLYLFVVYNTNFHGPDEPIYFAYTASVVEDGDLNVVNQTGLRHSYYFPSGEMGISKTYNLPDFHNHGGVTLWAPFYIYAKFVYSIAIKFNLTSLTTEGFDRLAKCSMSFSTIVFGFFTVLLTYMLCRVFFSKKISLWSTLVIFFGTPFFYYMLFEVGNANIIASLFSILSIWFCSYVINAKKGSHWFLYGLFFSIGMVIKVDLWFQIFFVFLLFSTLLILKQTTWKNGVYFFIGLFPVLTLKAINDYIKYGTFHIGELTMLNLKDSYLYEQLFSSYRGFFYTSPIFYISLLGFIFVIIELLKNIKTINKKEEKMEDLFFLILTLYLAIKIFVISKQYAWGGGTVGARPLLTEFPIFVLLYARAIQKPKKYLTYFIYITSIFFVFWNLLIVSEYMAGLDRVYITGAPGISARISTLRYVLGPLFYVKDLNLKLKLFSPLLLIIFVIIFYMKSRFVKSIYPSFWYIRSLNKCKPFKSFALFTIYLYIAYTVITMLNIYNNKRNVERLKEEGFFKNARVIGPSGLEKHENIGSMNEMIEYYWLKGDIDRVNKIERHKREMCGRDG